MFDFKYKRKFLILISIILIVISIKNLGNFFDVTTKPNSSDIIVSLGGDNSARIKKTLELYKNKFSKTGKIILTEVDDFDPKMKIYELDWRADYLVKKGIDKDNIIFNSKAKNTLEEVFFIKKYMIRHSLHSVIFVTDAPHSRRLSFFATTIANYQSSNISFIVVATKNNWWHADRFYTNPEAIIFVINESIKYSYYYIQYLLGNLHE